jgi:hypothetical protein
VLSVTDDGLGSIEVEGWSLVDVAEVAGEVVRFLVPVVNAYGGQVLDKVEDASSDQIGDAAVGLGKRLLRCILRREQSRPAVQEAVTDLAADPNDEDSVAALRKQVKKALTADDQLASEIKEMLSAAGVHSAGHVAQHVLGFDQAQQAVQGHGTQTVTFGSPASPARGDG